MSTEEIDRHIDTFKVNGVVEMVPNPEFCEAAQSLLRNLETEAVKQGETTNSVLLKFVDEGMSTALQGDNLRKMLHSSRYKKKGPFVFFFKIMEDLNGLFFAGKQSALHMLTSEEAKHYDFNISHESTECLDIICEPPAIDGCRAGATDQHRHVDAMFKHVQCIAYFLFVCLPFLTIVVYFN